MTLLVHIAAGAIAIVAGYAALFAAKGARLHRRSGVLFVWSMLVMALSGAGIAAVRRSDVSVIGGVLAAYLVVTALTTVRPASAASRRLDLAAMLVALALGLASMALGIEAARAGAADDGVPVPMFFLFGGVALLSGVSDLRAMRLGGLRGPPRIARHLWRMCFALWIATGSFFLGQADELPEPLRIFPLLAIPAFLPLLVIPYWLWRVRVKRRPRGMVGGAAPGARIAASPPEPRPALQES